MGISTGVDTQESQHQNQAVLFAEFVNGGSIVFDDTNSSGTGTVGPAAGGDADADEGLGILVLDTGAGAGAARNEHGESGTPTLVFRGSLKTVAELRVKLPATPDDISFDWGFDDLAGSSCKAAYAEGDGTWLFRCESQSGTDLADDATAVAALAGWNTLRLEWDPGAQARFYVNDVLVSTISTANAIPQSDDAMSVYQQAATAGATAGVVYLDWLRIVSVRA